MSLTPQPQPTHPLIPFVKYIHHNYVSLLLLSCLPTCFLCSLRRDRDLNEAMQWLFTAFPTQSSSSPPQSTPPTSTSSTSSPSSPVTVPICQPNDLTYSMLLTAAVADKQSWEVVFYLLAEMRLRGTYIHIQSYILKVQHVYLFLFLYNACNAKS